MEAKFTRTGHTIRDEETHERTVHKSINKAKKASRELQLAADGALGRGSLRRA